MSLFDSSTLQELHMSISCLHFTKYLFLLSRIPICYIYRWLHPRPRKYEIVFQDSERFVSVTDSLREINTNSKGNNCNIFQNKFTVELELSFLQKQTVHLFLNCIFNLTLLATTRKIYQISEHDGEKLGGQINCSLLEFH